MTRAAFKNRQRNNKLVDAWSLAHLTSGIVFGWLMNPFVGLVLLALYEPLEVFVLSPIFARFNIDFGYETLRNSLSDIFFDSAGIAFGFFVLSKLLAAPFHLF